MRQYPSIFNNVIGPVMRGPSSIHTAAVRIGLLMRQLAGYHPAALECRVQAGTPFAKAYRGQWAHIGLAAGLAGLDVADQRMGLAMKTAKKMGIKITFTEEVYDCQWPNAFFMTIRSKAGVERSCKAVSMGGGMPRLVEIDGYEVDITGGFYVTLIEADGTFDPSLLPGLDPENARYEMTRSGGGTLVCINSTYPLPVGLLEQAQVLKGVRRITRLTPVLPIGSQIRIQVPFDNAGDMLAFGQSMDLPLWKLAVEYESARGSIPQAAVYEKMHGIAAVMEASITEGLAGAGGGNILPRQSHLVAASRNPLLGGDLVRDAIANITAVLETRTSGGMIVAAPSAGSAGILPGVVFAAARSLGADMEEVVKAMLAAGLVGVFISHHATLAAEVGGCQAECGTGSAMAATALTQLMGGTARQGMDAAATALQSVLGLQYDPIADMAEVPCLSRAVMCGMNAVTAADMAMAGYQTVIGFDETVQALQSAADARTLHPGICPGLSATPTGLALQARAHKQNQT